MPINLVTKEVGEVIGVNSVILSVTTFTNLELALKIILLVVSIAYTLDKWYSQKKRSNEKKKLNSKNPRYQKVEEAKKTTKVLINNLKGVKIFAVFNK